MNEVTVSPFPAATGVRVPWTAVPAAVRDAVADRLGGRIVEAVTQSSGFSPAAAVRVRLADGRRAFVKAVGSGVNADSARIYRAEGVVARALPESVPAPRLIDTVEHDGWVALLFEDVEGRLPALPWQAGELARVLDAMATMAAELTPSPVAVPSAGERLGGAFRGWRRLAGGEPVAGLAPWALRNLDALADLEETWASGAEGDTLAHADIRADNVLLTADRVVVVDWAWTCLAAPWFDLVGMLPSVRMQGGPDPESLLLGHPLGRAADPGAVTAVLAALTGMFVRQARRPAPPGLPTLRAFQRAQGEVALAWLRTRTGWA